MKKTKKLRSFLVFCMDCFYMSSKNLPKKPKKTWVFLVFWLTSSKSSSKKQKKPWVFLVFSRSWPKKPKKPRQNKKNQTWASNQTFSEKLWFFGFLVFSRFRRTSQLFDFSLGEKPWGKPKNLEKTKKPKLFRECLVWGSCLVFFGFA